MDFITRQDFETHMYIGVINAISDNDQELLDEAIASAIAEACGYLARFDLEAILISDDRKTFANLRTWVKDIAKWHFVNICNAATDLELAETRYSQAKKSLLEIQQGKVTPMGWPLPIDSDDTAGFTIASRPKRGNYF